MSFKVSSKVRYNIQNLYKRRLWYIMILIFCEFIASSIYSQQNNNSGLANNDSLLWEKKIKSSLGEGQDSLLLLRLRSYNIDFSEKEMASAKEQMLFMDFKKNYKVTNAVGKRDDKFLSKPAIQLGGGYVSYNWSFRSGNDSSFVENSLSQHLIAGSFNATIAQAIPVDYTICRY